MPEFIWRGRNDAGDIVKGVMEGTAANAVADSLLGMRILPIEIKPRGTASSPTGEPCTQSSTSQYLHCT